MNKNILVLGSDGMVGRTVFLYLHSLYPQHVWGTTRKKEKLSGNKLFFSIDNYQNDFAAVYKITKKIDYVINCIGLLKNYKSISELIYSNSLFPHILEDLAKKRNFRLIHISTDAVFSPLSGKVSESSPLSPSDYYGYSKLLGETNVKNALTIRSSFIGFDPIGHHGLLEKVLKVKKIDGYTNHYWTGCTSLQFAQFCNTLISTGLWNTLRTKSPLIHFAPLGPISKYKLLETFIKSTKKKIILQKAISDKKNTLLTSNYLDLLQMSKYTNDIKKVLEELNAFEKTLSIHET
jgi:dTDP-4-dehydrorhamnose reductase